MRSFSRKLKHEESSREDLFLINFRGVKIPSINHIYITLDNHNAFAKSWLLSSVICIQHEQRQWENTSWYSELMGLILL